MTRNCAWSPRRPGRLAGKLAVAALFALAACSPLPDRMAGPAPARQAGPPPGTSGGYYAYRETPRSYRDRPGVVLVPPQGFREVPGYDAVGYASWYGRRYHGRRTASGERFNMNAPTAAHRTLPFGTLVRVTNMANGRSVVVRINDRGPFVRRRIIDVSRRAAEALGFVRDGTARVRVRLVQPASG